MESTLEEIETTQSTLASVMAKIPNYVIQNADQDKVRNVEESLAISEPLPPLVGPSGEPIFFSGPLGSTFQGNVAKQLRSMRERYLEGLL